MIWVSFKILTAASIKVTVFCSRADRVGSKYVRNVDQFLPDYTAHHPRTQPTSAAIYYSVI
jgi:hypothetical protein